VVGASKEILFAMTAWMALAATCTRCHTLTKNPTSDSKSKCALGSGVEEMHTVGVEADVDLFAGHEMIGWWNTRDETGRAGI